MTITMKICFILHFAMAYVLYMGLYENIEPALNISITYNWLSIPLNMGFTLLMFIAGYIVDTDVNWTEENAKLLKKLKAPTIKYTTILHRLLSIVIIFVLVGYGYIWLGSLSLLTLLILWLSVHILKDTIIKKRDNYLRIKAEHVA